MMSSPCSRCRRLQTVAGRLRTQRWCRDRAWGCPHPHPPRPPGSLPPRSQTPRQSGALAARSVTRTARERY